MQPLDFNPILWTIRIVSIATLLQTVELFLLRRTFNESGIWRWSLIRKDFVSSSKLLQTFFDSIFPYANFMVLLLLRLAAAIGLMIVAIFFPGVLPDFLLVPILILLLSTVLISIRWRGTFNGGSDYMTVIILTGLTINAVFPSSPAAGLACVYYITFHVCRSYFVSGVVKIKSRRWRNGTALESFVKSGVYGESKPLTIVSKYRPIAAFLSWAAIIFEITFPLAILNPTLCLGYLTFGLCFHLLNVYLLGLNRFFFAWAAAYPAIFWCSTFGLR